ncbi:MAG: butyrate kinase [Caldisericia bacterium]|nr:butyrate kinase [Caldisericia bacterium]
MEKILVINPGSTSTKIAIYFDNSKIFETNIAHDAAELNKFERIVDQCDFRKKHILDILEKENYKISDFTIIVGRGGLLKPLSAGTYRIDENMVSDLKACKYGEHASNLGAIIAYDLSKTYNIPAFIADPVSVDEFTELARLTGLKNIQRVSLDHPLNIRAILRKYCEEEKKNFENLCAVCAHLGGGISVTAFKEGKLVDVSNPNEGGPFSTTRAGSLPSIDIVEMCYSNIYDMTSLKKLLLTQAGLVSYLGTNDLKVAIKMMDEGNSYAKDVVDALCYQVSKEIGAMSLALRKRPEVIILTGGMSNSKYLVSVIKERVSFIAPLKVYPGSDEMEALAYAALNAKSGKEEIKLY